MIDTHSHINFEDYNKNAPTFCGYYARIIQRIQSMQPDAKIFLCSLPRIYPQYEQRIKEHAKLIHELNKVFKNTYVIDLYAYGPSRDEPDFANNFWLTNHLNPMGYVLSAKIIMSYIDYIIRNNPKEFELVGFIGKNIL